MRPLLLFIFSLSVLPGSLRLHAQIIATDYNTCMMGVKDNSNNTWIIEPRYEFVRSNPYGYIVALGGKYGLVDKTGGERIPLQYDKLNELFIGPYGDEHPKHFYVARNDDMLGIVDTANRVIAPLIYESYRTYRNSTTVALGDHNGLWYFYDLRGGVFKAPWKSALGPHRESAGVYSIYRRTLFGLKYGLFNDSGRVILDQKYDYLIGYDNSNLLYVTKGGKYGYCSSAGKFLWPMVFTNERRHQLATHASLLALYGTGPAIINGKYGLISAQGDTLLPFRYDEISPFFAPTQNAKGTLWLVKDNDWSGIYNDHEGWQIPIGCESIEALEVFYGESDSLAVGLLLYKMNGLFGVKTTSGQEILPCEFEEATEIARDIVVFSRAGQVSVLGFNTFTNLANLKAAVAGDTTRMEYFAGPSVINTIPDDHRFSVFRGEENTVAYYNPRETHRKLWFDGGLRTFVTGNSYAFVIPDSIMMACAFYVQHRPQPILQSDEATLFPLNRLYRRADARPRPAFAFIPSKRMNRLSEIELETHNGSSVYYMTSNHDVLRNTDVIINGDSIQRVQRKRFGHNGQLYFEVHRDKQTAAVDTNGKYITPYREKSIGDLNDTYCWRGNWFESAGYQLMEIESGKIIISEKAKVSVSAPIWDSITIAASDKNGMRLFNIFQRKYVTAEGYNRIIPLSPKGNVFAVKTCSGNMGIMDVHGKWIMDTIWHALAPVQRLVHFDPYTFISEYYNTNFYRYYFFTNDTGHIVYDAVQNTMSSPAAWREQLWNTGALSVNTPDLSNWLVDSFHRYQQPGSQFIMRSAETGFLPWQKEIIIDSMYGARRYSYDDELEAQSSFFHGDEMVCRFCAKRGLNYEPYEWSYEASDDQKYVSVFKNDSALSFAATPVTRSGYIEYPGYKWCSNIMLFADGPRSLTIDSLFDPKNDWRTFLINSVLNYVNTQKNVEGDCHNPAAIPTLLSQSFLITPEGLKLLPPGFTENSAQLVLTLPWNAVNPYLRADVKPKLPLHSKP